MSKGKRKRKKPFIKKQCDNCLFCKYVNFGKYVCENSNEVVMHDWQWTEHFASCQGQDFKPI